MTIETRMSYPEGGTECPPDENPLLPASSVSTASSPTSGDVGGEVTCGSLSSSSNNSKNLSESKRVVSNSQRCKLRSHKNIPSSQPQVIQSTESSEEIIKNIIANNSETDQDDKCTNCTSSTGKEKAEDLKKPIKAKPLGGDGSKEEAASRKSMRLRLRRGKADNSDDIFGPKERPRYVEDLATIDFDDDMHKIKFMDALGMSFGSRSKVKRAKMEFSCESSTASSVCQFQGNEKVLETKMKLEGKVEACMDCGTTSTAQGATTNAAFSSQSTQINASNGTQISNNYRMQRTPPGISLIRQRRSINSDDDDEGWECWLQRMSAYIHKPPNTSPTKKEINESLVRLVRLGTGVKVIITSGIS